jgi:hypothetical protein
MSGVHTARVIRTSDGVGVRATTKVIRIAVSVGEDIGRGGMGTVFVARDLREEEALRRHAPAMQLLTFRGRSRA